MFNNINDPVSSILRNFGKTNLQQELEKGGKPGEEGEIRDWSGKKYQKTGGKWIEVTDKKGPGKSEDPSGKGKGDDNQTKPNPGGPPIVDKHQVAQMTHMKSLVESGDTKGAYAVFQSLTPEAQNAVPQEVVNKMVGESAKDEDKGPDYDSLGKAEKKPAEKKPAEKKPAEKKPEEKKSVSDAKEKLGVKKKTSTKSSDGKSTVSEDELLELVSEEVSEKIFTMDPSGYTPKELVNIYNNLLEENDEKFSISNLKINEDGSVSDIEIIKEATLLPTTAERKQKLVTSIEDNTFLMNETNKELKRSGGDTFTSKDYDRATDMALDKLEQKKNKETEDDDGYDPSENESYEGHGESKKSGTSDYTTGGTKVKGGNNKKVSDAKKTLGVKEKPTTKNLQSAMDKIGFRDLLDKYAPKDVENLPDDKEYINEWLDSGGIDEEIMNDPKKLKADIIKYAKDL